MEKGEANVILAATEFDISHNVQKLTVTARTGKSSTKLHEFKRVIFYYNAFKVEAALYFSVIYHTIDFSSKM